MVFQNIPKDKREIAVKIDRTTQVKYETKTKVWFGLVYGVQRHFQQYFSHIMAVSFILGGNRR